ncbi:MAG TPA: hypothetical protein VNA14_10635 [Mycobacteriales bacterium]|nr:hypothetical protein [Mycobacteriales bacterium]
MGLLADGSPASPFGPIVLEGPAAVELDCLAGLVFGEWPQLGHHTLTVAGSQFADRDRGLLYDAIAGLRLQRPAMTLAQRLDAVPEHLIPTISVVLRWGDRPGFEPSAAMFTAARDALCHVAGSTPAFH